MCSYAPSTAGSPSATSHLCHICAMIYFVIGEGVLSQHFARHNVPLMARSSLMEPPRLAILMGSRCFRCLSCKLLMPTDQSSLVKQRRIHVRSIVRGIALSTENTELWLWHFDLSRPLSSACPGILRWLIPFDVFYCCIISLSINPSQTFDQDVDGLLVPQPRPLSSAYCEDGTNASVYCFYWVPQPP